MNLERGEVMAKDGLNKISYGIYNLKAAVRNITKSAKFL
jgi:hypothetical protein